MYRFQKLRRYVFLTYREPNFFVQSSKKCLLFGTMFIKIINSVFKRKEKLYFDIRVKR